MIGSFNGMLLDNLDGVSICGNVILRFNRKAPVATNAIRLRYPAEPTRSTTPANSRPGD